MISDSIREWLRNQDSEDLAKALEACDLMMELDPHPLTKHALEQNVHNYRWELGRRADGFLEGGEDA